MGESETTYRGWDDTWKHWLARFWWLRGVAAALSLAALVPNFIDVTRFEFLTAFHALVVGWNTFCAWIGKLIGTIPWFPILSKEVVSTFIFFSTIATPYMFIIMASYINVFRGRNILQKYEAFYLYALTANFVIEKFQSIFDNFVHPALIDGWKFKMVEKAEKNDYTFLFLFLIIVLELYKFLILLVLNLFFLLFLASIVIFFTFGPPFLITFMYFHTIIGTSLDCYVSIIQFVFFITLTVLFLILNIFDFLPYRRGFVYAVTFVAAMEVLYALNTPWLANQIREFPCTLEVQPPGTCIKPAASSPP